MIPYISDFGKCFSAKRTKDIDKPRRLRYTVDTTEKGSEPMSVCKKPLFWGILLAVLVCAVLAACFLFVPKDAQLKPLPCTYTFESDDLLSSASVSLGTDGKFMLTFSPISSHLGIGDYTVEGNRLILPLEGTNEKYVFKIRGETLVFDGKASTEVGHHGAFTDGAVFR